MLASNLIITSVNIAHHFRHDEILFETLNYLQEPWKWVVSGTLFDHLNLTPLAIAAWSINKSLDYFLDKTVFFKTVFFDQLLNETNARFLLTAFQKLKFQNKIVMPILIDQVTDTVFYVGDFSYLYKLLIDSNLIILTTKNYQVLCKKICLMLKLPEINFKNLSKLLQSNILLLDDLSDYLVGRLMTFSASCSNTINNQMFTFKISKNLFGELEYYNYCLVAFCLHYINIFNYTTNETVKQSFMCLEKLLKFNQQFPDVDEHSIEVTNKKIWNFANFVYK